MRKRDITIIFIYPRIKLVEVNFLARRIDLNVSNCVSYFIGWYQREVLVIPGEHGRYLEPKERQLLVKTYL